MPSCSTGNPSIAASDTDMSFISRHGRQLNECSRSSIPSAHPCHAMDWSRNMSVQTVMQGPMDGTANSSGNGIPYFRQRYGSALAFVSKSEMIPVTDYLQL
jgi:hypothetical protein